MSSSQSQAEIERDRLFELSLDLLCIGGLDGYFKQINPSWTRVLGWSKEELLARPIVEFMHPEDRAKTLQARAELARGVPLRGLVNRYLCKDGSFRYLSWQSSSEPEAGIVFAVARDVTVERQLEQEKLVVKKMESTGLLAGGMAHDFNNLLASLLLNLEMVPMVGPTNPEQRKYLQQAKSIALTARDLTEQIILFAQGDNPSRQITPMGPFLKSSFELSFDGSSHPFEYNISENLGSSRIDPGQIKLVISHLVMNAKEASDSNGMIRLHARNVSAKQIEDSGLSAEQYVCFSISDEGCGISEEDISNIFDPYYSTKRRGSQKGMGLGLTICHSIIKRHHGIIKVDSTPGCGTTVSCYIPVASPVE